MWSQDQFTDQTSTGLITLPDHNWDAYSDYSLSENCQSRTSMCVAGLLMPGSSTLLWEVLVEDSSTRDQLFCTITLFTPSHSWTTQIFSSGTLQRFFQRILLCPMLIESGRLDKLLCSINITEQPTDTETESQDMYLGMVLWISQ